MEPSIREDAVSGSGCAPGADVLPAGWWYGTFYGAPGNTLSFDLACYYWGAAAEAQGASRGDYFINDYYIVNDNPQIRVVPIADGATASCVLLPRVAIVECAPQQMSGTFGVWIRVDQGGSITRIFEQYAP